MVKVTKGNKIEVTWTITRYDNGETAPVVLPDDLCLTLYTPTYQEQTVRNYSISDNVIHISFEKDEIALCGVYSLGVSWENSELYARATKKNAFKIVQWTEDSDMEAIDEKDIAIQYLEFATTALWTNGSSEYYTKTEIDKMLGDNIAHSVIIDLNDSGSLIYETIQNAPVSSHFVGMDGDKKYFLSVSAISETEYSISYYTEQTEEHIDVTAEGDKNRRFIEYY